MISKSTVALALATCLSVAAGFVAPDIIGEIQSKADSAGVERFAMPSFSFQLASGDTVAQALEIAGGADISYPLEEGEERTFLDVKEAVIDASKVFVAQGFGIDLSNVIVDFVADPYMAYRAGSDRAAILWRFEGTDGEGRVVVDAVVDDATGKVVSYTLTDSEIEGGSRPSPSQGQPDGETMCQWMNMWGEYLGIDCKPASEVPYSSQELSLAMGDAGDSVNGQSASDGAAEAYSPGFSDYSFFYPDWVDGFDSGAVLTIRADGANAGFMLEWRDYDDGHGIMWRMMPY